MEVKICFNKDTNGVILNDAPFDYDVLYKLALKVIDEGIQLNLKFENFEEIPDIKTYYEEIFQSINELSTDEELNEIKSTLERIKK